MTEASYTATDVTNKPITISYDGRIMSWIPILAIQFMIILYTSLSLLALLSSLIEIPKFVYTLVIVITN